MTQLTWPPRARRSKAPLGKRFAADEGAGRRGTDGRNIQAPCLACALKATSLSRLATMKLCAAALVLSCSLPDIRSFWRILGVLFAPFSMDSGRTQSRFPFNPKKPHSKNHQLPSGGLERLVCAGDAGLPFAPQNRGLGYLTGGPSLKR